MTTVRIPAAAEPQDLLQTGPVTAQDEVAPSRLDGAVRRVTRPLLALRAVPHLGTYTGMALTVVGGVLLLVAWRKTAGLTNVGLQMPYLISAGCTGLALVAVGLTVVNLAAKAEDSRKRREQVRELHDLLAELRRVVEADK